MFACPVLVMSVVNVPVLPVIVESCSTYMTTNGDQAYIDDR